MSKLNWLIGKLSKHSGNIDGLIQAVSSFMPKKEEKAEPTSAAKEQGSVLKTSSQINDFYGFLSSDMMQQVITDLFARRRRKR